MADPKAGEEVKAPTNNDAPNPDEKKDPPAPRTYSQEEVDRIATKVRRNAARDAELRLRREAPAREAPPAKEDPPKEETEPQRDDFDTFEAHQRALAAFEGRRAAREERKKEKDEERQRSHQEQQTNAQQAWAGKIERAQEKHADFEDVLEENAPTLELIGKSPMRSFITESDIGPEIIRALCLKPDEVKRIAALPAYKQAAEIAKIEDTLVAAAKPEEKEEPKAGDDEDDDETTEAKEARERNDDGTFKKPKKETPKLDEPIEPVGARPARVSAEPLDSDDADTWRRKETARLAKLRGR